MAPSSLSLMRTLQWIRRHGLQPVPLLPRSKAAVNRNYVQDDYVPPDDKLWITNDYNLGLSLGVHHGGVIDVDLDSAAAVFCGDRFFPPTKAVFGRPGKPRSHRVYRVNAAEFPKRTFADPVTRATIVELRGDGGHQTVMPGSIHQDTGEEIEWSDGTDPEITVVEPDALLRAARMTGITDLIASHLWHPGYHNEPTKHLSGLLAHLEWTLDDAEAVIGTVMEFTGDDDKSRLPTVRNTFRRAGQGQRTTGAGRLREQLPEAAPAVDKLIEWAAGDDEGKVSLLNYNEDWATVMIGGFKVVFTKVLPSKPYRFFTRTDFLHWKADDLSDPDENGKRKQRAALWLAQPRRRKYLDVDFTPGADQDIETGDAHPTLNLWTGWAVEPEQGDCGAWLEMLRDVVCGGNPRLNNWVLHWLANILREPTVKPATALVLIGKEGAGKTLLLTYFGKILGHNYVPVSNAEQINGRFNSHHARALLLHSEEAIYAGDKKHASITRSLITDPHTIFEQKNVDAVRILSYLRMAFTSNHTDPVAASISDRRYTVIDCEDRRIRDNPELEQRVKDELYGTGPAALHHFLVNMAYDPAVPRLAVKTASLNTIKRIHMDPMERWWEERLELGELLDPEIMMLKSPVEESWPGTAAKQALAASAQHYMDVNNIRTPFNVAKFYAVLQKMADFIIMDTRPDLAPLLSTDDDFDRNLPRAFRHLVGKTRLQCIGNLPSLVDCRAAWERYALDGDRRNWVEPVPLAGADSAAAVMRRVENESKQRQT